MDLCDTSDKAVTTNRCQGRGASYKYVGVPSETAETSIGVWALEFNGVSTCNSQIHSVVLQFH